MYKMISVNPRELVYCISGTKNYSDKEFKKRRLEFLKAASIVVGAYHTKGGLTKMK